MDDGDDPVPPGRRASSPRANGHEPGLYRVNSNQSSSSIFEDVEMAQDEVCPGPAHQHLVYQFLDPTS